VLHLAVSAAMSKLRHVGPEAHAKILDLAKGGRVGVVGSCGASRDSVSGHGPALYEYFRC